MRITDLLSSNSIELDVKVSNKQEAIDKLVELMNNSGKRRIKYNRNRGWNSYSSC